MSFALFILHFWLAPYSNEFFRAIILYLNVLCNHRYLMQTIFMYRLPVLVVALKYPASVGIRCWCGHFCCSFGGC